MLAEENTLKSEIFFMNTKFVDFKKLSKFVTPDYFPLQAFQIISTLENSFGRNTLA